MTMATYIEALNLAQAKQAMMTCTYCGFCKSVCPSFESLGWDASVARGRMILAYGLLQKEVPADESVVEYLYQCTTCKDCERRCPSNIEVVDVVERARRDLAANGAMLPRHRAVVESVQRHGNPYGEGRSVVEVLGVARKSADLGYFVGCTAAYRNPAIARATASILRKLGEEFAVVDAACCGSVMQRLGCPEDEVAELMERNLAAILERGADEVVFSCAGCYRMFKEEYPRHVKVPFKVRHISEFLADRDLKLDSYEGTITYHDPCHLGRHSQVYDAPRKVLRKIPGAVFKEMPKHGEAAHCCGGGGGVRSGFPTLARDIASRRMEEAAFADVIATACPFCVSNLEIGAEASGSKVRVADLVQLIDPLLGG
jgi:Fe-S oxidoreductase